MVTQGSLGSISVIYELFCFFFFLISSLYIKGSFLVRFVHMKKSILAKPKYKDQNKPKRKVGRPIVSETTKLSRKQELFVKILVSQDGQITKRDAAIEAGFPASSAHQRAYEMTNPAKCPHVVRAIQEYRGELDRKYGIDYQRHVRDLQKIRDAAFADKNYSAAVMAEYRRGQAQGNIYINKSEIRHGTIDSMSKDEVLKALNELRGQINPVGVVIDHQDDEKEIDGKRLLVSSQESDKTLQATMENN